MNGLERLMRSKGLTAYALAKGSGTNPATVYRFAKLKDLSRMPLGTAAKLAKALSVDLNELYREIAEGDKDDKDDV